MHGMAEAAGEAATRGPKLKKLSDELDELFGELEQIGCFYQDPSFTLGLVDFPAIIDGEEVLLCWRSDEPGVAYYHGPEGYRGRRPIPKAYLRDMPDAHI